VKREIIQDGPETMNLKKNYKKIQRTKAVKNKRGKGKFYLEKKQKKRSRTGEKKSG